MSGEAGAFLTELVERHLRANGDWNVNDWRAIAEALLKALKDAERERERLRRFMSMRSADGRRTELEVYDAWRNADFGEPAPQGAEAGAGA